MCLCLYVSLSPLSVDAVVIFDDHNDFLYRVLFGWLAMLVVLVWFGFGSVWLIALLCFALFCFVGSFSFSAASV